MKLQNIISVLMAIAPLLMPLADTDLRPKSRWMDLISGITRTSRDVIMGTVGRVREIFPPEKIVYPDDSVISEFVEYLKGKMKYSHPSLELPVLDPFVLRQLDLNITNEMIGEFTLNLEEISIIMMSEFNVNKIKMNWLPRKLEFDVRFPEIHTKAKYNMKGVLGNLLPVHGYGPASISAINVNLTGTMDLGIHNNSLHIRKLTLNYFIEAFRINMTNLMGGGRISELMNTVLSQEGTEILELVRTDVTYVGTNWLHSVANDVLQKMSVSFSGMLDFIKSAGTKKFREIFNSYPFKRESKSCT